jgi:hypothetical protein
MFGSSKTPQVLGLDDFAWKKGDRDAHAAGRFASPLSGRGPAGSGSGSNGVLSIITSLRQTKQTSRGFS